MDSAQWVPPAWTVGIPVQKPAGFLSTLVRPRVPYVSRVSRLPLGVFLPVIAKRSTKTPRPRGSPWVVGPKFRASVCVVVELATAPHGWMQLRRRRRRG